MKKENDMKQENDLLREIAEDLHWMARRYADNRRSYATSALNDCTRELLRLGVKLKPTIDGTIWARDGMGRRFDGLTDEEAAMGSPPDDMYNGWCNEDVEAARAERDAALARVEELTEENRIFRAAQKACEYCDAPTMAETEALRARVKELEAKS